MALLLICGSNSNAARAQSQLSGIAKLACEAILCLSSATQPSACGPSLSHYFGLKGDTFGATAAMRSAFLAACPIVSSVAMDSLKSATVRGAGRCDAPTLNRTLSRREERMVCPADAKTWNWGSDEVDDKCRVKEVIVINNQMPQHCTAWQGHEYTDLPVAKYVGVPGEGGKWISP